MKKVIAICLGLLIVVGGSTAVFAGEDSIPAAQAAFASTEITGFASSLEEQGWEPILYGQIKTGTPKDLVINVSAETFLGTYAQLNGDVGTSSTAEVQVRVLVDGNPVLSPCLSGEQDPDGIVTFDNRMLSLEGDLTHHINYIGDWPEGMSIEIDDHWIAIYMTTASAHSFNFIATGVGQGTHDVVVEARLATDETEYDAKGKKGEGEVFAAIGHVNAVIDEVMFKLSR